MKQVDYFSKLCLMEAKIHEVKAYHLIHNHQMQIAALDLLRRYVNEIFDEAVSGDKTKLYLAD